jgi:hypothetical protein
MFFGPVADLCMQGDVFVTQDDDVLMLTVQFRNGCNLNVKVDKRKELIEQYELLPNVEMPEEVNQMVMDFIDYMVSTYADD